MSMMLGVTVKFATWAAFAAWGRAVGLVGCSKNFSEACGLAEVLAVNTDAEVIGVGNGTVKFAVFKPEEGWFEWEASPVGEGCEVEVQIPARYWVAPAGGECLSGDAAGVQAPTGRVGVVAEFAEAAKRLDEATREAERLELELLKIR